MIWIRCRPQGRSSWSRLETILGEFLMHTHRWPLIFVLLAGCLPALLLAQAPAAERTAAEWAEEGTRRWQAGDAVGAEEAFSEAVLASPEEAPPLLQRGIFYQTLAGFMEGEQAARLLAAAEGDFELAASFDPNSRFAGVARDALRQLRGPILFPEVPVTCPPKATEALARAEDRFALELYKEALKEYAVAAGRCPESAAIWMAYGEAFYGIGELTEARLRFRQSLQADPWNRIGHNYLSYTETQLGNLDEARREAALAIVSDPTSEASWSHLKALQAEEGKPWHRVYGEKTRVEEGVEEDGREGVRITVPTHDVDPEVGENAEDPDLLGWTMYGIFKAGALRGITGEGVPEEASEEPEEREAAKKSPLEIEQQVVGETLDGLKVDLEQAPFWQQMERARSAGFLTEAIFFHLMDRTLVPEYLSYRSERSERLVRYLLEVVAGDVQPSEEPASPADPSAGEVPDEESEAVSAGDS